MKKETKKTLYGAYGSNMNLRQMSMRCPTAKVVGTAMLKGYELLFRGVATVERNRYAVELTGKENV